MGNCGKAGNLWKRGFGMQPRDWQIASGNCGNSLQILCARNCPQLHCLTLGAVQTRVRNAPCCARTSLRKRLLDSYITSESLSPSGACECADTSERGSGRDV